MGLIIHYLLLTDGCPGPQLGGLSIPQRPYVPKQNYCPIWNHVVLVPEKLGQQRPKSMHQSLVALSVGPNKMHVWRSRGCSYSYPYKT